MIPKTLTLIIRGVIMITTKENENYIDKKVEVNTYIDCNYWISKVSFFHMESNGRVL